MVGERNRLQDPRNELEQNLSQSQASARHIFSCTICTDRPAASARRDARRSASAATRAPCGRSAGQDHGCFELHHSISNDLHCHPADRRCLGSPRPVIDGGHGQKTARLRRILRPLAMTRRRGASESAATGSAWLTSFVRHPLMRFAPHAAHPVTGLAGFG